MKAAYLELSGRALASRAKRLSRILRSCRLCPRRCGSNRLENEVGYCRTGRQAMVSSFCLHRGEEPPISGHKGSGTIFFTHCNLACRFCQNYEISHDGNGHVVESAALAEMMLSLQKQGCHNVNLVSPSHVVAQIVEALCYATARGFSLPLVYNSNGYDSVEAVNLLDGIIDIYLPDIKYSSNVRAREFSDSTDYWDVCRKAVECMYAQVGNLTTDACGVGTRGLLIRHLVLPHDLAGSCDVLDFVAYSISRDAYISIMSQYHPCYQAHTEPLLSRVISKAEYDIVVEKAIELGLRNAFIQERDSAQMYLPDFADRENPFSNH